MKEYVCGVCGDSLEIPETIVLGQFGHPCCNKHEKRIQMVRPENLEVDWLKELEDKYEESVRENLDELRSTDSVEESTEGGDTE